MVIVVAVLLFIQSVSLRPSHWDSLRHSRRNYSVLTTHNNSDRRRRAEAAAESELPPPQSIGHPKDIGRDYHRNYPVLIQRSSQSRVREMNVPKLPLNLFITKRFPFSFQEYVFCHENSRQFLNPPPVSFSFTWLSISFCSP